jgi:hypothetical protein
MPQDNAYLEVIRKHYPQALDTNEAVDRLLDLFERHLGLSPRQIMSADSICSDDLNAIEYPHRAYEMLGPFKMGGLNGFPFTGLTGMNAFAHHVPADGAVFVFYAPHIGITQKGKPGEILRPGQTTPSACCGAAKAALGRLLQDEIKPGEITELDYQQNTIEQIFLARKERIVRADDPMLEATEVMYEAIEERINTLAARTQYPCRYLVLMGGILINASEDMGSFCCARRLECLDLTCGKRQDLLRDYLGAELLPV